MPIETIAFAVAVSCLIVAYASGTVRRGEHSPELPFVAATLAFVVSLVGILV